MTESTLRPQTGHGTVGSLALSPIECGGVPLATDPGTLTPEAVVRHAPDLAMVEVDGETIVYEPVAELLHHLDPVATAVWTSIDGTSTLEDLARGLADRFEASVDVVLGDVLTLAEQLVTDRLVQQVHDPEGAGGPIDDPP